MPKNILILSTSLRKDSNSDALAAAFARGAAEAGHHAVMCSLRGKALGFCVGCLSCQKTKRCVIRDDAPAIVQQMKQADILVFATPIYYYEMCGQMKTLLDRANPALHRRLRVPRCVSALRRRGRRARRGPPRRQRAGGLD